MEALKTSLFNEETTTYLTNAIKKVYPSFKEDVFLKEALIRYDGLELKSRVTVLTELLYQFLPHDFSEATTILKASIPYAKKDKFVFASYPEYLETYGCNDQYVELSFYLMEDFTKLFSAEFAIRRFFNKYKDKTLKKMLEFSKSQNVDVRRLSSEGSRPSLPWSVKIDVDHKEAMKPLENLFMDNARYVTRSVANHLNDISKIDPDLVINTLSRWKQSQLQDNQEMDYIINHSLRTLIKKGNQKALNFIGFKQNPNISIEDFNLSSNQILIGDTLHFTFTAINPDLNYLMIDYIIEYPSKTSKTSQKVYKLRKMINPTQDRYTIRGKRSFKNLSTRKMKQGKHRMLIQVNGIILGHQTFNVK
jgi:3-methyladenine DNA glycosylase AlkC